MNVSSRVETRRAQESSQARGVHTEDLSVDNLTVHAVQVKAAVDAIRDGKGIQKTTSAIFNE